MNCLDFRKAVGAEPGVTSPERDEHRASCPSCAAYAKEIEVLDGLIVEALRVDIPDREDKAATPTYRASTGPRWGAIAASVLLVFGVATGIWITLPRTSLAEAVLEHMHHESYAMVKTAIEIDTGRLAEVLNRYDAGFNIDAESISYARHCFFRMQFVPHLVVQGDKGPVMVLLLPDEHVDKPTPVSEEGYEGTIYPHLNGSIAIVGVIGEDMHDTGARILEAVDWQE